MIFGKLSNGAASIQRTLRDHAPRVADCGLEKSRCQPPGYAATGAGCR